MLRGLGLLFRGGAQYGDETDVHEAHVFVSDVFLKLTERFDEGHRFDVAQRAAQFDYAHFGGKVVLPLLLSTAAAAGGAGSAARLPREGGDPRDGSPRHPQHPFLYRVRHVRDDLHRLPQIFADPFPLDDLPVDLSRAQIGFPRQAHPQEALVVPQIQIGLAPVVQHEYLPVLERTHGPRVDVQVRVDLEGRDSQSHGAEEHADGRGGDALSDSREHAAGDDDDLTIGRDGFGDEVGEGGGHGRVSSPQFAEEDVGAASSSASASEWRIRGGRRGGGGCGCGCGGGGIEASRCPGRAEGIVRIRVRSGDGDDPIGKRRGRDEERQEQRDERAPSSMIEHRCAAFPPPPRV
mmetsp:Transcript_33713/g.100481  ORF Transcript_33713/g.100481 Transcript_33713/m.100481 type:complete len:350 (-) Transcript_33713:100-1149(-)